MFAVPIILNSYYNAERSLTAQRLQLEQRMFRYDEKLSIGPVNPYSRIYQELGWIPGAFINNTGTVPVKLDKLYLIDVASHSVYAIVDLSHGMPNTTTIIAEMYLNPNLQEGYIGTPVPRGQPIVLQPGDVLVVVFNKTNIMPVAANLVVRVESSDGILHPISGGGYSGTLLSAPGGGGGGAGAYSIPRGIYITQSGFKLIGYNALMKEGEAYAWTPPLRIVSEDLTGSPSAFNFKESFIYNDPKYPGLYYLKIVPDESIEVEVDSRSYNLYCTWNISGNVFTDLTSLYITVGSGDTIEVHGYVGTYDAQNTTYFSGYAFQVLILDSSGNQLYNITCKKPYILYNTTGSIRELDFDGNGIKELVFTSLLNGPTITEPITLDADGDGNNLTDALVWTYMIARDISGVDFIRVDAKINYYWTDTAISYYTRWGPFIIFYPPSCPSTFRHLRIFSLVVWKYDKKINRWIVYDEKDFSYTNEKPKQYHVEALFPVERNGVYRVGLMFYDNYRDWDGYGYECYKDFAFALEHMIVEYGVLNPLFKESPPVYIVAIPDASLINGINAVGYASEYNISNITEAKVDALETMLSLVKDELGYAGVTGYTVITNTTTLCNLLFNTESPPKYAIILWLQGNTSIGDVLGSCGVDDSVLRYYIAEYHWVWVWPYGNLSSLDMQTYEGGYAAIVNGPFNLSITPAGLEARAENYAFYLYNVLNFSQAVKILASSGVNWSDVVMWDATFYADNSSSPTLFGDVALRVYDNGVFVNGTIILNPIEVAWNVTGGVGAPPRTIVEEIVYSALRAWNILRFGSVS
ncbi:MAG: hypothetical protein GSR80_000321 [Desulfurococcales archaeon]|nr:hypothetical protein [Desulfurococcales archaeon]